MKTLMAALSLIALVAAAPAGRPGDAVTVWAERTGVPLDDDARLLRAIGNPQVLALGEFAHGAREPLVLRNRLVRLLAERGRLDMVALESGLVEGRRLNDYVMGGLGDAETVVRRYLNWGFNLYPENVELLRWLRAHNAQPGVRRVAIYGVDIPGGDDRAIGNAAIAVTDSIAWLRRAAPGADEGLADALSQYARELSLNSWFALSPTQRAELPKLADRLVAFHARDRRKLVAATSAEEQAWAERTAIVLRQVIGVFEAWPKDNPEGNSPNGMFGVVEARDAAMAANTLWLLRRAQPGARMLLFMHNGHVEAARRVGPPYPGFPDHPQVIGERLRGALGPAMTVLLTNAGRAAPSGKGVPNAPGSFGAALADASGSPFLVDLRRAPQSTLLNRSWRLGHNMHPGPDAQTVPAKAADLVATFPAATDVAKLPER